MVQGWGSAVAVGSIYPAGIRGFPSSVQYRHSADSVWTVRGKVTHQDGICVVIQRGRGSGHSTRLPQCRRGHSLVTCAQSAPIIVVVVALGHYSLTRDYLGQGYRAVPGEDKIADLPAALSGIFWICHSVSAPHRPTRRTRSGAAHRPACVLLTLAYRRPAEGAYERCTALGAQRKRQCYSVPLVRKRPSFPDSIALLCRKALLVTVADISPLILMSGEAKTITEPLTDPTLSVAAKDSNRPAQPDFSH
ncbi:hypothetical protein BaRGS_00005716 [Batillaria attramentaria]|uniref:Uncharacterized protein n=1 Tax=Batillaria attramentaria TaxID=370345 RepID=A0ABD0LTX5_9CAEN